MKDLEIANLLSAIIPESEEQKDRLFIAINLFKDCKLSVNLYLDELNKNHFLDRETNTVYRHYKEWCEINELTPVSAIEFGKYVHINCNVKSKVVKINRKPVRVYKST